MVLETTGSLRIEANGEDLSLSDGQHIIFAASTPYSYVNTRDASTSLTRILVI
ncbi:hypothetical protein LQ938_05790 [Microbacterium sp. cx-55]|uniref:hypothetical protein n=1 Tax=unclassified Microbacterium TaxID=2609290 RepID=UPI001CBCC542|nr:MULTISPECIES: hypothetical protein [unclassified Microbacterium]MBZ4486749.1 hypothetical protein [Microbacterium sp. cx-55]MCC4907726.1 hypothetical protein [Microbacterium sp. cx-59]UGB36294.1 hypothetical protein LQ938_05790 [Microbacterium sp. cx-55]